MKKSIVLWQTAGFAWIALCGTLLHFLYDLTESLLVAPFSGINESTWEHMKLLFWPAFLFAILQGFFFRERKDFWCVKLRGILLALFLIPAIFYTYNGAIGKSPDWVNISIFFISAAIACIYETKKLLHPKKFCSMPGAALAALCVLGLLFVIFTFKAPQIGIFKDPISGLYGL